MRSEAEIRRQVETRLRRWALLVLNAILWIGAAKLSFVLSGEGSFGRFTGASALFMALWAALIGLHVLRTVYIEVREITVRRAIEHEQQLYSSYEKPKRLEVSDDGELVDWNAEEEGIKAKHER